MANFLYSRFPVMHRHRTNCEIMSLLPEHLSSICYSSIVDRGSWCDCIGLAWFWSAPAVVSPPVAVQIFVRTAYVCWSGTTGTSLNVCNSMPTWNTMLRSIACSIDDRISWQSIRSMDFQNRCNSRNCRFLSLSTIPWILSMPSYLFVWFFFIGFPLTKYIYKWENLFSN